MREGIEMEGARHEVGVLNFFGWHNEDHHNRMTG